MTISDIPSSSDGDPGLDGSASVSTRSEPPPVRGEGPCGIFEHNLVDRKNSIVVLFEEHLGHVEWSRAEIHETLLDVSKN